VTAIAVVISDAARRTAKPSIVFLAFGQTKERRTPARVSAITSSGNENPRRMAELRGFPAV
jgi:hypothetical protein